MTKAEFGRRMHIIRQAVNSWMNRQSWGVKTVLRAGKVLECDLVAKIREEAGIVSKVAEIALEEPKKKAFLLIQLDEEKGRKLPDKPDGGIALWRGGTIQSR